MHRISILILGALFATGGSFAQTRPSVRVTVLNEKDEPVRGAFALTRPVDRPLQGPLRGCESDQSGNCTVEASDYGRYDVTASKVDDAYPEQVFSFYGAQNPPPPIVTLSAGQPQQSVIVHLGRKAGILMGTVTDANSGKPIDASVTFCWLKNPQTSMSGTGLTNAKFRVLVPSDIPVTMVVSRKGYDDWTYSLGRGEFRSAILLKPGEELALDIRLRPKG